MLSTFSVQRVSIIGDASLFDEGISRLLTFNTNLKISAFGYGNDDSSLEGIAADQPDVIVVAESEAINSARILEILFSTASLTTLYIYYCCSSQQQHG